MLLNKQFLFGSSQSPKCIVWKPLLGCAQEAKVVSVNVRRTHPSDGVFKI